MAIAVDEMLSDLRTALEQFDNDKTYENYDAVHAELMRISMHCEMIIDDEE